jgi:holin-like protein
MSPAAPEHPSLGKGVRAPHWIHYLGGMLVIGVFCLLGWWLAGVMRGGIPAPIFGMVLLATALHLRWIPIRWVDKAGSFLLRHMSLFFLPILLGAGEYLASNRNDLAGILAAVVGGTVLSLWSAYAVCRVRTEKGGQVS